MRKKLYLLLALMLVCLRTMSEEKVTEKKSSEKDKETEIEISLDSESLTSTNGIDIIYGPNKFKVFDVKRDTANNKMYINGDFTLDSYQPTGDARIESKDGVVELDGSKGTFGESFGFLEVGKVTGAEAPNDKIYFGGQETIFANGNITLENSWLTTDPKINERELTGLGYYIQSENIFIEPDKQVTLKDSDLFIQDMDVMPFTFPWYRFNIRQGSQVPLFPMWGSEDDYGWTITTGVLYGDRDSKFKGGFAPKFGDQMGLLIGRMENWYDTGVYGESRLNITDLLVHKKGDSNRDSFTGASDDYSYDDRWDIDYSHNYTGEYGHFNFGVRSVTYNMNENLKDIIEDYDAQGKYNHYDKNNKPIETELGKVPDMGDYSNYYTLDTELTGLGNRKDITIKSKVKLTDDKEAYSYIVNDQIDDLGYDSQVDNELFSEVFVEKDNEDYKINGYYNYLYDMDPGSNVDDLQSRAEDFGFLFEDKNRKISLTYDEKNGDKFRKLNSWERNPSEELSSKQVTNSYGLTADYVPWTVSQYDVYDSAHLGVAFGEYELTDSIRFKTGYDYSFVENELNLENDPLREKVFEKIIGKDKWGKDVWSHNNRWSQYNRFEDIIYEKSEEHRAFADFSTDWFNFTVAGGTSEEEIHTREGINSGNDYAIYKNESDFYEFGLSKYDISLGYLGDIDIYGNIRQDKYKSGNNTTYLLDKNSNEYIYSFNDSGSDDKTTRYQAGLNHRITLIDNTDNQDRWADIGLDNEFKFFYQDYTYDGGNSDIEYGRLINKDNIYRYGDKISFEFGNTETVYNGEYTVKERPSDDEKTGEIFKNNIDFLVDGDKVLSAYYNTDDRYIRDEESKKYYNDLTFKDYGFNYYLGNHEFYFKNQSIDNFVLKNSTFKDMYGNLDENIRENVYGYVYTFDDKRLNLEYTEGKDSASYGNADVLDINNRIYAVNFSHGDEIEHSYGVKYEDYQGNYKPYNNGNFQKDFETDYNSNVITLRYGYKDKRLSEEELAKYAQREYGKDKAELTEADLYNIRHILENRESVAFNLNSVMDNKINFGQYRRSFDARLTLESNDKRRHEESYGDSLSKIEAAVFYSQNRIGLGYTFTQEADYNVKKGPDTWGVKEREHEFSFQAKVGKPSEGWRLRTYIQFYDNIDNEYGDGSGRRFFDEAGVEIGKEMGYYEWSVAYVREYSLSTRDYEWKTALQFTLLTFPDKRLFGIGAKGGSAKDTSTDPDVHVFSGIKVKNELEGD